MELNLRWRGVFALLFQLGDARAQLAEAKLLQLRGTLLGRLRFFAERHWAVLRVNERALLAVAELEAIDGSQREHHLFRLGVHPERGFLGVHAQLEVAGLVVLINHHVAKRVAADRADVNAVIREVGKPLLGEQCGGVLEPVLEEHRLVGHAALRPDLQIHPAGKRGHQHADRQNRRGE